MKHTIRVTLTIITILISAACHTVKKGVTTTSSAPVTTNNPISTTNPFVFAKPEEGTPPPGNEEVAAILTKYKDVTLDKLKEGHSIYTSGTCTRCHDAKSIYEIDETQWKSILDDMAQKADISDVQKDAVYKYVLAIKATRPR